MSIVMIVLAAVMIGTAAFRRYRRHRRAVAKAVTHPRIAKTRQARKDAFYLQNFWSYDGSEQEEFEE